MIEISLTCWDTMVGGRSIPAMVAPPQWQMVAAAHTTTNEQSTIKL